MTSVEAKIRAALKEFWDERAIETGPSGATTVEELLAPVESITALDVLVTLDEITKLQLPNSVIRKGGYDTCDQFVNDLTGKVMKRLSTKSTKGESAVSV